MDQGARCPLTLYICGNKSPQHNDLQSVISTWSMASFGLPALIGPADVTCIHIGRFDSRGRKSLARPTWETKVWLPFFVKDKLELDNIPYQANGLSYHLGSKGGSEHYCAAILGGGNWRVYADDMESLLFGALPLVARENCCPLWLNCQPHGGAAEISKPDEESPILKDQDKVNNIIHDLRSTTTGILSGFLP